MRSSALRGDSQQNAFSLKSLFVRGGEWNASRRPVRSTWISVPTLQLTDWDTGGELLSPSSLLSLTVKQSFDPLRRFSVSRRVLLTPRHPLLSFSPEHFPPCLLTSLLTYFVILPDCNRNLTPAGSLLWSAHCCLPDILEA